VASLSSAWRGGENRPTFSIEAKPRYLRSLQHVVAPTVPLALGTAPKPEPVPPQATTGPSPVFADKGHASVHAVRMVWPIACRRLEGLPNISATQLFEELSTQFPGRFTRVQYKTLLRRVNRWREDARARGVDIGRKTYQRHSDKPRGRKIGLFERDWPEISAWLEARPDQTARRLLVEIQARYPGRYESRQVYTLQRYVRKWRKQQIERLICDVGNNAGMLYVGSTGNSSNEAIGNKVT
jgi:hypothetical protein